MRKGFFKTSALKISCFIRTEAAFVQYDSGMGPMPCINNVNTWGERVSQVFSQMLTRGRGQDRGIEVLYGKTQIF